MSNSNNFKESIDNNSTKNKEELPTSMLNTKELKSKHFKRKSKKEYIEEHNLNIAKIKKEISSLDENLQIELPIKLEEYNPLNKKINKNFQEIKINSLEINSIYKNKYLYIQIMSKIFITKSVNFLGEDANKDIINISIFNSEQFFDYKEWEKLEKGIFKEGNYILFIEPNYKISKSDFDVLIADYLNDIIIFNNIDDLNYFLDKIKNESPENYKLIGNLMVKNNFYEKAILYYNEGIKLNNNENKNDEIDIILHLNLSEAYIQFGYFTKCIQNADYCLNKINTLLQSCNEKKRQILFKQKTKAFYRKIKGLVSLRKFKETYEMLFNISNDNPDKDFMKELLKLEQIRNMIDIIKNGYENNIGHFNFKKMVDDEKINFELKMYGDYVNPKIEVRYEEGKGIKLTAKEKIKEGELLLVEKALVSSQSKGKKKNILDDILKISIDNPTKIAEVDLFNKLAKKLLKFPLDYEKFYYLYDGDNLKEDISKRKKYLNDQENGKIKLTNKKVNGAICNNKYGIGRYFIFYNEICKGVWGYPSFLNHDCLPNSTYLGIGDFYISFCIKEISIGEEITSNYCSPSYTYEERQNKLFKNWGFKCNCELCKYQEKRKEPDYNNFIKLFTNIISDETRKKISLNTVHFFEEFLVSYTKNFSRYEMANGYLQLVTHYSFLNDISNTKKFSALVTKYAGEKNYLFQVSNLYTLAVCINECNEKSNGSYRNDLFIVMRDIEDLLKKYTPFTNEEIRYFIDDNINHREMF